MIFHADLSSFLSIFPRLLFVSRLSGPDVDVSFQQEQNNGSR